MTNGIAQPSLRLRYNGGFEEVPKAIRNNPAELAKFINERVPRAPEEKAELELYMRRSQEAIEPKAETSRGFSFGMDSARFRENFDSVYGMYRALEQNRLQEVAKFEAAKAAGGDLAQRFSGPAGKRQADSRDKIGPWATETSTPGPR